VTTDMGRMEAVNDEELLAFLRQHVAEPLEMELMAFWGRHPGRRLPRDVIAYAITCSRLDLERALGNMTEAGLIQSCVEDRTVFYWLSPDDGLRRLVVGLASLGWERKRDIVGRLGKWKS
jgi:hypothetical protein